MFLAVDRNGFSVSPNLGPGWRNNLARYTATCPSRFTECNANFITTWTKSLLIMQTAAAQGFAFYAGYLRRPAAYMLPECMFFFAKFRRNTHPLFYRYLHYSTETYTLLSFLKYFQFCAYYYLIMQFNSDISK